jgi:hypothetical protein
VILRPQDGYPNVLSSRQVYMTRDRRKHQDTSVSLHPLSFEEAIRRLAQPKRKGSQAEESDSTKSPADRPRFRT